MMKIRQSWLLYLALAFTLLGGGCGRDLTFRYEYNGPSVETASAYSDESLVAIAKRTSWRPVGGPTVVDIEVEETHFAQGTQEVIYKGRLVFRCRTNEAYGERITDTPLFGKRPRDVFRRWPYARMGISGGPLYP